MSLETIKKVYQRKSESRERLRMEMLERVTGALDELSGEVSFQRVFIFGSVTVPGRFAEKSDIDLAFQGLDDDKLFYLTGKLSCMLERDVNVLHLDDIHFKDKILKTGIEWKNN